MHREKGCEALTADTDAVKEVGAWPCLEVLIPPKRTLGAIPGACVRQDLWEAEIDFVLLCREGHAGLQAWFVRRPSRGGGGWTGATLLCRELW